jgi:hypothetical protein
MDSMITATWIQAIGCGLWVLMARKVQPAGAPNWLALNFYCSTALLGASMFCFAAALLFGPGSVLWGLSGVAAGASIVYVVAAALYSLATLGKGKRTTAMASDTERADGWKTRTTPQPVPVPVEAYSAKQPQRPTSPRILRIKGMGVAI